MSEIQHVEKVMTLEEFRESWLGLSKAAKVNLALQIYGNMLKDATREQAFMFGFLLAGDDGWRYVTPASVEEYVRGNAVERLEGKATEAPALPSIQELMGRWSKQNSRKTATEIKGTLFGEPLTPDNYQKYLAAQHCLMPPGSIIGDPFK